MNDIQVPPDGRINGNPHNLPSHLSEGMFRVYEPHIKRAVDRWDSETEFIPEVFIGMSGQRLSGNTFVARFRDATASLLLNDWTTDIDVTKLRGMSGNYAIGLDPATGSVWWRNKQRRGRPAQFVEDARAWGFVAKAKAAAVWKGWDGTDLAAVCLLMHKSFITGPIVLDGVVGGEFILSLEQRFNVAMTVDEVKGQTILT